MNNTIANLEIRLIDIPGDMCETKARYIENSKAFIATLTDDEAAIRKGLNRLAGAEMIADIREEGAGAWEFWASEGMLSGIRNRDLAALKA